MLKTLLFVCGLIFILFIALPYVMQVILPMTFGILIVMGIISAICFIIRVLRKP